MPLWDTPIDVLTGETKCIPIEIPDNWEWERLLLGALDALSHEYNWSQSPGGLSPELVANRWRKVMVTMVGEQCEEMIYPDRAFLPGSLAKKTTGDGTLTTDQGSTFMLGQRTYITPTAVGGRMEWNFVIQSGTYELRTVIQRINSSNGAIMDWFLDGNLIIDNMSFLGSSPNVQINTTIAIITPGLHTLACQVMSITGSAQLAPIHYIQLIQTGPDGGG